MAVLSFAAVGFHGRECWMRIAAIVVFTATLDGQSPSSQSIVAELAARISAAVAPAQSIALSIDDESAGAREELTAALRARGVTTAVAAAARVLVSCGRNLRDRVCVAEIVKDGSRQTLTVAEPRASERRQTGAALSLELRPLLVQREAILDVVQVGDGLLVLQPTAVALRPPEESSRPTTSPMVAAIPSHSWPRDLRGRLRITSTGFEAFLPGVVCRGRTKPLTVACSDDNEPWPVPIENAGIAASRNYFTTPEGFAFYGAAPIGKGGPPRWLAVDRFGALVVLDERRSVAGRAGAADDVVRLAGRCADGTLVATASRADAAASAVAAPEQINLHDVVNDKLVPITHVPVAGTITALWPGPGDSAMLVVRSSDRSRYEAFHVGLSCAR